MILLKQMLVLFIIMLVGAVCRKVGIFTDEVVKKLSSLIVNVANPAMMLASAMNQGDSIKGHELLITGILACAMFAGLIVVAVFVPYILRADRKDYGVYRNLIVFANLSFMGFPLVRSVYGAEAILYAAIFCLPFNVLIYTYGMWGLLRDKEVSGDLANAANTSNTTINRGNPLKKILLNVGVIACVVSLALFFIRPAMPSVIVDVCNYIGNITPPISMMIIGDSLTKLDFKKLFTNVRLLFYCLLKLIVVPVIGVSIARLCGINGVLLGVFVVMMAGPAATMNAMVAQECDASYELASEGVALTTILSVATIPLVYMILGI